MKKDNSHNEQWTNDDDFIKSLPKVELPYSRSKEAIWNEMDAMMNEAATIENTEEKATSKVIRLRHLLLSVAAVLALLLGTTAFFSLYTKTVNAPSGQHLTALLPDGSSIELNAGSAIKYKPYWWRFNREVQFEGEGFFKVQKGKSFEVVSSMGRTIVLGTSFNIYARKNEYKVTCYTGKVRVVSVVSGESTDITPNMQVYIRSNGNVVCTQDIDLKEEKAWVDYMFIFTGTPLQMVFEEVERQYGVRIQLSEPVDELYSGNFTRDRSADEVMKMICRSMGLELEKSTKGYRVSK